MTLQGLIRWLLPREDHFYDYLEQQAEAAHLGAKALARLKEPDVTPQQVREAVQAHEAGLGEYALAAAGGFVFGVIVGRVW